VQGRTTPICGGCEHPLNAGFRGEGGRGHDYRHAYVGKLGGDAALLTQRWQMKPPSGQPDLQLFSTREG
jgi:hypothetical protein